MKRLRFFSISFIIIVSLIIFAGCGGGGSSLTPSSTGTLTPEATINSTPSGSFTNTQTPTVTSTPTLSATPMPTLLISPTSSVFVPTLSPIPSPSAVPTVTVSIAPTITITPIPEKPIIIFLDCIVKNSDGSFTAYFGYENQNNLPISIPSGDDNQIIPGKYHGQPVLFLPGSQHKAFCVVFKHHKLEWRLKEYTVTAYGTPD